MFVFAAAGPPDIDVLGHVAQGGAAPGRRLPEAVRAGEHRVADAARQPQHQADRRGLPGLRERVQVRNQMLIAVCRQFSSFCYLL